MVIVSTVALHVLILFTTFYPGPTPPKVDLCTGLMPQPSRAMLETVPPI